MSDSTDWSTWGQKRIDFPPNMTVGAFKGKGSYGEVYEAAIVGSEAEVAIKILRDYSRDLYSCDEQYKTKFLRSVASELSVLLHFASKKDSHIPRLHLTYFSEDRKDLYLAITKTDGSLQRILQDRSPRGFTEKEVRFIMTDVLRGLASLHAEGLCHLDVSSHNVLSRCEANDFGQKTIKANETLLSDFSFVKPLKSDLLSTHLVALGYRCPELLFLGGYGGKSALIAHATKSEESSQRTFDDSKFDIFAAGVLMCELLFGKLPVTVPAAEGTVVDPDEAARRQFLAVFTDLVPTFNFEHWSALHSQYKKMREEFPTTSDDMPIFSFFFSEDDQTEIKIKPKAIDRLQEEGLLSSAGASLLASMIAELPEQRPSAAQLLSHEWFQNDEAIGAEVKDLINKQHQEARTEKRLCEEVQKLQKMPYSDLLGWIKEHVPLVATNHQLVKKD